jgi:anti-sigma regulatory factor (Ser/Thr protein kinase)
MTNPEADMTQSNHAPSPYARPEPAWQTLAEFILPSELDSEPLALEKVVEAVQPLNLSMTHLERLKTAVAEATLNAIEHGNRYRPDLPVAIRILASAKTVTVSITDQGSGPIPEPQSPDLAAKVAGQQPPRGWGFFLIEKTVDAFRISGDEAHHTIELFLYLEGKEKQ